MCGFVGIYNYGNSQDIDEKLLIEMRDIMVHRGPDDFGIYISRDRKLGLGHRRLSIIDLSPRGRQPMSDSEGKIWIVYNGEVYNFPDLRKELEKKYTFRSRTDTEVLIYLYKDYGKDMVHKLRGMFAFAIWDENKKELWLVRDRMGIKPLYYTFVDGKFIFASEIKAILRDPSVKREVNEEGFYHYLSFLTTPPPQTLFQGIYKIPAGHMLTLSKNGNSKLEQYWDVFDNIKPLYGKEETFYTERLLELLRESVKLRMISDVPIGVFLSGGIDSSTNTALFSEFANDVKTFSIGYKGQEKYNEFQYARKVADIFRTKHYETIIDVDDLINFLEQLVYYQDEAIADPVCVPVYFVSKLARDNGVTVCQVGEGADELFCGYRYWKYILQIETLSQRLYWLPLSLWGLGLWPARIIDSKGRIYELLKRKVSREVAFWGTTEAFYEHQKDLLLSNRLRDKFKKKNSLEIITDYYQKFLEKSLIRDYSHWMSYIELKLRLPELLLMRVDKMSMAVSLEARVPFLDHKLVEFTMGIPQKEKIKKGEGKYIFKRAVDGLLPDEIIYRQKKPFGVPIYNGWFLGRLGDFAIQKIRNFTKRTDFFNSDYVETLLSARSGPPIWYILNFVLWCEKWMKS